MDILKKFYNKEDSTFHVLYREKNDFLPREKVFLSFRGFAKYLKKDLSDANLYDFSFENIDLTEYNIENALIKKEILEKFNLYDSSFYDKNILPYKDVCEEENNGEIIVLNTNSHIEIPKAEQHLCKNIFYVSDLHLNHKISNRFPTGATVAEIKDYLNTLVYKMIGDNVVEYLLIAGDTSFNFKISQIFYDILSKTNIKEIFVVLGNHDIWDSKYNNLKTDDYNTIIKAYENIFKQYKNIHFVNNSLLTYKLNGCKMLSEDDIKKYSDEEIRKFCNDSYLNIFGGIGFTCYNKKFNVTSGLYRDTITSVEQEKKLTLDFENLYKKLSSSLADYQLICLTHMPKEDWSNDDYNVNWIYVNGHTHRNYYRIDKEATIYADNQIGYNNENLHLNNFFINYKFDYFKSYEDGIYKISALEYKMFYAGLQTWIEANRRNGQYYMIKKNNNYCFFWQNKDSGKLYLLEGGIIHSIKNQDINYYYNEIEKYAYLIKNLLNNYNSKIEEVSHNVKKFGGSGRIHGCIVDIDFYSHVYINPYDDTIIPYFATDMINKFVYTNIATLLYNNNKDLYLRFKNETDLSVMNENWNVDEKPRKETSTTIYKISRIIYSLQRTSNFNVVRLWKDEILSKENITNKDLIQLIAND